MTHRKIRILGTSIDCATYQSALDASWRLACGERPAAVSACNTHIVSAARFDPSFARVMERFDMVLPDGTPLKWLLNMNGAMLPDRVYGPYFMRYAIENAPESCKHYFFGGSQSCLDKLKEEIGRIRPDADIAAMVSPPYGEWTGEESEGFIHDINESGADFIWVALGGERQERWIVESLPKIRRGVLFAVGDAFELVAGRRPFAPSWMQQRGLTWLYRLLQEPRRLWPRYLRHNTMFILQLLGDWMAPRHRAVQAEKSSIAFLGLRGVPAKYAGFETVVDQLGRRLARRGHFVTVYNRTTHYRAERPPEYLGMRIVYLPTIMAKQLETIVHSSLATLHAMLHSYDTVYVCGVGNSLLAGFLKLSGKRTFINVDGIDFKRSKWAGFARSWLHRSEKWAIRFGDVVVADNNAPVRHYEKEYGYRPQHIAYGTSELEASGGEEARGFLEQWGVRPGEYLLFVSRLSPENEVHTLIEAYKQSGVRFPLVITGSHNYEEVYWRKLQRLKTEGVVFTGGVYGDGYRHLSSHCRFFVLPAAIEATRLVLLDQMGYGNAILFRECEATREVIGNAGLPFGDADPVASMADGIRRLADDRALRDELARMARERARTHFSWETIADQYEALLENTRKVPAAPARHSPRMASQKT